MIKLYIDYLINYANNCKSDDDFSKLFDVIYSAGFYKNFCKRYSDFDCYIPDTTYERDVMAFLNAASEYFEKKSGEQISNYPMTYEEFLKKF